MPLKVSRRKAGGSKAKYNERRNSLQAPSHMLILTVAMGISSCSGNCVHLLEKHKVRGTNTAWENIAFLPPAQRERLFINEEEWKHLPLPSCP